MKVTVKLYTTLRDRVPGCQNGACEADLPDGISVQDVLSRFSVPADMPAVVLINGVQKTLSDRLLEGDTLSVFPPIAGG